MRTSRIKHARGTPRDFSRFEILILQMSWCLGAFCVLCVLWRFECFECLGCLDCLERCDIISIDVANVVNVVMQFLFFPRGFLRVGQPDLCSADEGLMPCGCGQSPDLRLQDRR